MLKTSSTQMETGATASVPRDMGEEKDEPDFIETHCHWVGCDREMGCNDELVKVITTKPPPSPPPFLYRVTKSDLTLTVLCFPGQDRYVHPPPHLVHYAP